MRNPLIAATAAIALFAGAVALADEKTAEDGPDPRIGEEVNKICFVRTINGWKALKGVDNVVLLEKGVNDWYYVELQGYCPSRLFRTAETIGIDSKPSGGCLTKGDVIIVNEAGNFPRRCFVKNISKWDDKAEAPETEE